MDIKGICRECGNILNTDIVEDVRPYCDRCNKYVEYTPISGSDHLDLWKKLNPIRGSSNHIGTIYFRYDSEGVHTSFHFNGFAVERAEMAKIVNSAKSSADLYYKRDSHPAFDPTKTRNFREFLEEFHDKKDMIFEYLHRGTLKITNFPVWNFRDLTVPTIIEWAKKNRSPVSYSAGWRNGYNDTWCSIDNEVMFCRGTCVNISQPFKDEEVIELLS